MEKNNGLCRIHIDDMSLYRIHCTQHVKQRLQYYCKSCKRSICEQCKIGGGHQGLVGCIVDDKFQKLLILLLQSHIVMSIDDAFRSKMNLLRNCIEGKLAAKQSHLLKQLSALEVMRPALLRTWTDTSDCCSTRPRS